MESGLVLADGQRNKLESKRIKERPLSCLIYWNSLFTLWERVQWDQRRKKHEDNTSHYRHLWLQSAIKLAPGGIKVMSIGNQIEGKQKNQKEFGVRRLLQCGWPCVVLEFSEEGRMERTPGWREPAKRAPGCWKVMAKYWKQCFPPLQLFLQSTWWPQFRTEPWQFLYMQTQQKESVMPQSSNILYVTLPIPSMSLGTPHYHLSFSGFHPPHLQLPPAPLLTCGETAKPRPLALSYPKFLFFLSAPLPDAFWLLRPELRAQLSIMCLTFRRQSSAIQFKESKNKTEEQKKKSLKYLK